MRALFARSQTLSLCKWNNLVCCVQQCTIWCARTVCNLCANETIRCLWAEVYNLVERRHQSDFNQCTESAIALPETLVECWRARLLQQCYSSAIAVTNSAPFAVCIFQSHWVVHIWLSEFCSVRFRTKCTFFSVHFIVWGLQCAFRSVRLQEALHILDFTVHILKEAFHSVAVFHSIAGGISQCEVLSLHFSVCIS